MRTPPTGLTKSVRAQFMKEMALLLRVGRHVNVAEYVWTGVCLCADVDAGLLGSAAGRSH